jgi:hypothetical protein
MGVVGLAACSRGSSAPLALEREAATTELVQGELTVDGADEIEFGASLAFGAGLALVGAPAATRDDVVSGAVFAFLRKGSSWAAAETLEPPDPADGQRFGQTLGFTGNRAAVVGTGTGGGAAVWLFPWDGTWSAAEGVLPAPTSDGEGDPGFGLALALDDSTLLVGAPLADSYRGHVYVYERVGGGWDLAQTLPASNDSVDSALYGIAIALDGNRAVIGASGEGPSGAVYVLERDAKPGSGSSTWTAVQRIAEPDTVSSFGSTVALATDALAIGAPQNGTGGAVYTYRRDGGEWGLDQTLKRDGAEPYDYFGMALGFSESSLFVGSPGVTTDDGSGRVYEFHVDDDWSAGTTLSRPVQAAAGSFGIPLSASRSSTLLVADVASVYAYLPGLGSTCSEDYDCDSGHCSEGVCCDEACDEVCHSCLQERKAGKHDADGVCGPVASATDPRDDCATSKDPCGTTGVCSAEGACALALSGTACRSAGCSSPTEAVEGGACTGAGECRIPEPTTCATGYACRDAVCSIACASAEDCDEAAGYYCYALACVKGARCSPDRSVAIDAEGGETTCANVLCQDGACLEACARTDDCAGGLVCDPYSHDCVTEASLTQERVSSGSSCELGRRGGQHSSGGACWLLALLLGLRRWRNRRLLRTG